MDSAIMQGHSSHHYPPLSCIDTAPHLDVLLSRLLRCLDEVQYQNLTTTAGEENSMLIDTIKSLSYVFKLIV